MELYIPQILHCFTITKQCINILLFNNESLKNLEITDRSFKKLHYHFKHKFIKRKHQGTKRNKIICNNILEINNIFERTGLFDDRFEELYQTMKRAIMRPNVGHRMVRFVKKNNTK